MGRIKSGDIWANDDFMQHVACDAMARRENDERKAGAMARMEARCKNALRFIGGGAAGEGTQRMGARNKVRGGRDAHYDER